MLRDLSTNTTSELAKEAIGLGAGDCFGSQPSLLDIAYLAGIIDGEGYIGITKGLGTKKKNGHRSITYSYRITVANSALSLMLYLHQVFGSRLSRVHHGTDGKNWKRSYCAVWYSSKATEILKLVSPFLVVKKKQAEIGLKWPNNKSRVPKIRESLYCQLRVLNRKGKPVEVI